MFSLGNAKLSDDTLIIKFYFALRCPSLHYAQYPKGVMLRRKQITDETQEPKVDMFWRAAMEKYRGIEDAIDRVFGIARKYIEGLNAKKEMAKIWYKKANTFYRFNEAGDFPVQVILMLRHDLQHLLKNMA